MGDIDNELVNLRQNLNRINGAYAEVDNTLKFKWKEIKKLDTLENDLNKLKHLSELPNMFKIAITKYESKQEGVSVFKEPIRYFDDYSDVLHHYKQTVSFFP
jgi:Leucine-rich repeat (LRR) protein